MEYTVHLLPHDIDLTVPEGANLLHTITGHDPVPDSPCGGVGKCGKCKVLVNGTEQLACQTEVRENMTVVVPQKKEDTIVLSEGVAAVSEIDPLKKGYLLAVDIGTTTVVCYLLDKETGKEMANASCLNPQQPFGADVISRIRAALGGEMQTITTMIRDALTELIQKVCTSAGIAPSEVSVISVVGNPAMQQLFLGVNPKNLVEIPFGPVLVKAETTPAAEYLPILTDAVLLTIPDIAGYVGADTIGCVLSTRMDQHRQIALMVDIGTNGEMVLGNNERMTACATAAGPALEGANIRFGMRGAPGAIDHVTWDSEKECLSCHVIGEEKAVGICGSGLIDAIAVALDHKMINKRGRITSTEERDGDRYIPLCDDIFLTQEDIRQVMLAKGSIAAGIQLMAEHIGIQITDIDVILLAGAFGSFLNPNSACRIGLLPPELREKVHVVGNAAGSGAKNAVLSQKEFYRTEELVRKIEFIELANIPTFQRVFAKQMALKE
ncbi:MAG: DUF4445 domain-containing protein [Lachnospiraceae bacterium]|nr:DUF4445 domain-containing protein [Lachnospiraceae bacterium]